MIVTYAAGHAERRWGMANKMTGDDKKELLTAIGIGLLIIALSLVLVACIALTIIGIVKGYI